jgi:hypothetical protein
MFFWLLRPNEAKRTILKERDIFEKKQVFNFYGWNAFVSYLFRHIFWLGASNDCTN